MLAVIAFHAGLNSVPGGFYGVDSLFVLSGYLITSLLVRDWGGTGTIPLRRFFAAGARRLLPAQSSLSRTGYSIHRGVTYFSLSNSRRLCCTRSVSPAHRFAPSVDQINVGCTDGVHFTPSGGIYVGLRRAPVLAALGQAHATASPGGGWPGPLPPSTPSWFSGLPCQ